MQAQFPLNTNPFEDLEHSRVVRKARAAAATTVASLRNASAGHATEITVPQHIARISLTALVVALGALLFATQIGATLR